MVDFSNINSDPFERIIFRVVSINKDGVKMHRNIELDETLETVQKDGFLDSEKIIELSEKYHAFMYFLRNGRNGNFGLDDDFIEDHSDYDKIKTIEIIAITNGIEKIVHQYYTQDEQHLPSPRKYVALHKVHYKEGIEARQEFLGHVQFIKKIENSLTEIWLARMALNNNKLVLVQAINYMHTIEFSISPLFDVNDVSKLDNLDNFLQ